MKLIWLGLVALFCVCGAVGVVIVNALYAWLAPNSNEEDTKEIQ